MHEWRCVRCVKATWDGEIWRKIQHDYSPFVGPHPLFQILHYIFLETQKMSRKPNIYLLSPLRNAMHWNCGKLSTTTRCTSWPGGRDNASRIQWGQDSGCGDPQTKSILESSKPECDSRGVPILKVTNESPSPIRSTSEERLLSTTKATRTAVSKSQTGLKCEVLAGEVVGSVGDGLEEVKGVLVESDGRMGKARKTG